MASTTIYVTLQAGDAISQVPPGLAKREARAGNGPAPFGKKRSSRLMEPEGKLLKGLLRLASLRFAGESKSRCTSTHS